MYGPVGRGKSWIVNAVFDAAPAPKVRVHSHEFFHRLHARVHSEQGNPQALRRALDDIVGARRLLVFDELHIHDPGDARFFTRLLEYVLAHETTIIVTSNYAPDDLLPNPVWHHIMEAGTALIADNLAIHRLAGSIDYRTTTRQRDAGFAAGAWVSSSPSGADRRTTDTRLHLGRRSFPVVAVDNRHLWVTFDQICDGPLSTIEYDHWASLFDTWTISDIPLFEVVDPEAQQRFINLVDILVDRDVHTTFRSPHTVDEFLTSAAASRPDTFRMVSRMHLLRVAD